MGFASASCRRRDGTRPPHRPHMQSLRYTCPRLQQASCWEVHCVSYPVPTQNKDHLPHPTGSHFVFFLLPLQTSQSVERWKRRCLRRRLWDPSPKVQTTLYSKHICAQSTYQDFDCGVEEGLVCRRYITRICENDYKGTRCIRRRARRCMDCPGSSNVGFMYTHAEPVLTPQVL
jgi:hypothetical protein